MPGFHLYIILIPKLNACAIDLGMALMMMRVSMLEYPLMARSSRSWAFESSP